MPPRVLLHVGLPKSGTTYLQAVLVENKARLADAGLLFPGAEGWRDQVLAVRDVRGMPSRSPELRREVTGAWDRLVDEIHAWPGDSVVSMEWLSRVQPQHLRRVVDSLAPRQVELIWTVRDLARVIPASWQESVLNQRGWSWPDFLAEISDEDVARGERRFWRLHDILALIDRWIPEVPPARMHVVTVPPPGSPPSALWDRFASVLGVGDVRVDVEGVKRNDGLGFSSSELMRRLRERAIDAGLPDEFRRRYFTQQLAKQGLVHAADRGRRPTIPPDLHAWVREQTDHNIAGLTARGVRIVGDLGDLRPDLSAHTETRAEPTTSDLLDVALHGLVVMAEQRGAAEAELVAGVEQAERRLEALTTRHEKLKRRHAAQAARWRARPLRTAVRVYARRSSVLRRLAQRRRAREES